jgi:hypothetical protein
MIISELQYFPPVDFVSALFEESYIYLDIYEPYRKMSFRNRCMIAGAQGIISLSVPLQEGRNQRLQMKDVLISNAENWQGRHLKSLCSAYSRSPFFEYYVDELSQIYQKPVEKLTDWNLVCLNWIKEKLAWKIQWHLTEGPVPFQDENFEDQRNRLLPKNYKEFDSLRYRQVFEERTGFFPNLSILDLLFNAGPGTPEELTKSGRDR